MTSKSANPLRPPKERVATKLETDTDLAAFCDDGNRRAKKIGADWWYRVIERTLPGGAKRQEVEKIEGHRAIELRREAEAAQKARVAALARNPAGD